MINMANKVYAAKAVARMVEEGELNFDIAIQRGPAWKKDKKVLFIHSLIEGFPVPPIYTAQRTDGNYDGLDGKQRISTVIEFLREEFNLGENFIITNKRGEEENYSNMTFGELPEWAQEAIKDYSFTVFYFQNLTDAQYDEIFYRLNNGKPLTAVEMTRVKAKSLRVFQELAKHDLIDIAVTEKGRVLYNHENLVMQAWALCFASDGDDFSFETKTFRGIIENAVVTHQQAGAIKNIFNILLNVYNEINPSDARTRAERADTELKLGKRIATRIKSRTHLVGLAKCVMIALENDYDISSLAAWVKAFFNGDKGTAIDEEYNRLCLSGSARKMNVAGRMEIIANHMHDFFAELDANETAENYDADEDGYCGETEYDEEYGDEGDYEDEDEADDVLIDLDGVDDSDGVDETDDDELVYLNEAFEVGKFKSAA